MSATLELYQDREGQPCCRVTRPFQEPEVLIGAAAIAAVRQAVADWDGTTAEDTAYRLAEPKNRKLTRNRAQCLRCGDVVESTYVHDFQQCTCKRIFVDGGLEYRRVGYALAGDFVDLCEYE